MEITAEKFKELREKALELHATQPSKGRLSLDAVFTAIVAAEAANPKPQAVRPTSAPGRTAPPAPWFTETLAALKGKGESMTVSRFLLYADRFPVKRMDQINAARWLREAGIEPRKSGGNLIFDIP